MPLRTKAPVILATLCLLSIFWIGCSDDTIIRYVDGESIQQQSEIEEYFPLHFGFTTIYHVSYQSGYSEQVTYRAADTVNIRGLDAVSWIGISTNSIDTSYFYTTANALYYFRDLTSEPEKLLDLPFTYGKTWSSRDINTDDFTDIYTGYENKDEDSSGVNAKTFPTISTVEFTVDQIERLDLNNGNSYSSAVRISTPNGTKKNYYWYVKGIGLVRYVIGASTSSYPDGDIVGEILDYGIAG